MEPSKEINDLSYAIIGAALKIQLPVSLIYHNLNIPDCYRLDLLIEDKIIIELKAVRTLDDIHYKQLLTYLSLMKKELGLLINFNETILKNGIKRVINQKWT